MHKLKPAFRAVRVVGIATFVVALLGAPPVAFGLALGGWLAAIAVLVLRGVLVYRFEGRCSRKLDELAALTDRLLLEDRYEDAAAVCRRRARILELWGAALLDDCVPKSPSLEDL
jgi:hypothetical protein